MPPGARGWRLGRAMNPVSGLVAPVLALLPAATAPGPGVWSASDPVVAPATAQADLLPAEPAASSAEVETFADMARAFRAAGTARGIEFGTSPFDEGLRKSVERTQMLGVPTYRFIAARQRLSTTFTIFLQEIPAGFSGVRDVRVENGRILVENRNP